MIDNTYVVYTLIDVSNHENVTAKGTSPKYKQYQNYNSFLQVLSFRTQVFSMKSSKIENADLSAYKFGSKFQNETLWRLIFQVEANDIWKKDNDMFYHAHHDLTGVPIYAGLSETAETTPIIECLDKEHRNTYLEKYIIA